MTGSSDDGRPAGRSSIRTLTEDECYQLLAVATVGRLGFVAASGDVEILPLDFRLAGDRVLFKSSGYGILSRLADERSRVAFEVDYHAPDATTAWSVLMQGTVSPLDKHGVALLESLRLPLRPWPGGDRTRTLQFLPELLSGRSVTRRG